MKMVPCNLRYCFRVGSMIADNAIKSRCVTYNRLPVNHTLGASYFFTRKSSATTSENVKDNSGEVGKEQVIEEEKKIPIDVENLNKDLEIATEKVQLLEDKYLRSLAESENLRTRLTKQIEDARLFGIQGFCKDLLEVSDILQRATESVPKEEVNDENPHLKNLYEGLKMTEAQLQSVFRRHGLVPLNPLNEKFNPNLHEALFQQEVEGKEAGTVVVVSKIGYKLHERVIRPALVGVAKS